jgi:archaellum component FlaC
VDKKLDKLMKDYQESRRSFSEAESKLQQVIDKSTRLEEDLPSLRAEISRADTAKARAIHRYVLKEITEVDMGEAKTKAEKAKEAGKRQTEEIDMLLRFKENIEQNLPRMKEEIRKSGAAILEHLVEGLRKETKELVGDKLAGAWSLNCLVGSAVEYQQFLELIFPLPQSAVMARYQSEYQHKFLGNEELKNEC